VFAIVFGWVLCSVIRTIPSGSRKSDWMQRTKSLSPLCGVASLVALAELLRSFCVVGRYSALAAIIIFSLGIWCHKFDLVISFTGYTLADQGQSLAGSPTERRERERARGTVQESEHGERSGMDFLRERAVSRCCQKRDLIRSRRYTGDRRVIFNAADASGTLLTMRYSVRVFDTSG